jgi:hypothetical protein
MTPSGVSTDIGADRGRQQTSNGGGSGLSAEKQRSNRRRVTTAEAVPSDKTGTVEPMGNNNRTATVTSPKNWQDTAWLTTEPLSGRQGEDSVDSDNISSSVSLQPHKGGKHSGIYVC